MTTPQPTTNPKSHQTVVVHVGAGHHSPKMDPVYRSAIQRAIAAARHSLLLASSCNAASPPDSTSSSPAALAVVAAIKVLEDDPALNAGLGSNLTWDGRVECDASVMDGQCASRFGAVGAASGIRNPVEAAARIMEFGSRGLLAGGRVPPMLLTGPGASHFLTSILARPDLACDPKWLVTSAAQARHARHMAIVSSDHPQVHWQDALNHDTVGAIVLDAQGNLAAGVSSGGISLKYPGRVGEAAVYGAGVWAQNASGAAADTVGVGVSCSGVGENIVQSGLARQAAGMALAQEDQDDDKLREAVERNAGQGMGLCMLVHDAAAGTREVVVAHSTPSMGVGIWDERASQLARGGRKKGSGHDGVEYVMSRKREGRASCLQRMGLLQSGVVA